MTKIRLYILLLFALITVIPANAVLKEDSLGNTLGILRQELTKYHDEYGQKQVLMRKAEQRVFKTLMQAMQNSNQNALMLYSQKDGYVFDLSYACHEAIREYKEFERHLVPFTSLVEKNRGEVVRMDSLIQCLKAMPVMVLDKQAKIDRDVCLALAVNTRRMVAEDMAQMNEYIAYYKMTESRLKYLNDYANGKYAELQNSIFMNGSENYWTIISRFGEYIMETRESIGEKYRSYNNIGSQWDARWMFGIFVIIAFYGLIAVALNLLIVRWLGTKLIERGMLSRVGEWFMAKRTCIVLASTAVTFAIILGVVLALAKQDFIVMASSLLVQFAWLMSVIIISTLLRVDADKTLKTLYLYMPLLVNGFIVISFRVVLIPNALVNLVFPPILLICCLWQWRMLSRLKKDVDRSDRGYASFSQFIFIVSLCSSMFGYTLLSVQILIWWIMQLTCILTITCMRDWYRGYADSRHLDEKPITETWYHGVIYSVGLPTAGVFSVVLSLYWAADVFNLTDLTLTLFTRAFIDTPNFKASIFGIAMVVTLWFVFNYINRTAKAFVKYYLEQRDSVNAAQRFMMVKNVMQVVVWGIWFLVSLAIFNISSQWIVIISGGLSTGIGFASKDILENIYYGISLMMGRIKIGDLIVCDGIRGTVSSISYTSTMIDTTDGSVIAFQNSQLFTKNYKNMTRNHGYELHALDVGVAYGTNVAKAKELIINAVGALDCIDRKKGCKVVLKELGDSALLLKVIVWVDVFTQYSDDGVILECIYNTLNDNGIEIPFPQTDVHIKNEMVSLSAE
ncbi:MAG: mechanosensitive ion channel family protein [Prevotellaceae bacterium]|nr:mechanosensitive ion channel family protein [Prevotellaceae bacterium]MDO4932083.1 mechanosensitive ion channel family protein [Prevotellaceae bacterium]